MNYDLLYSEICNLNNKFVGSRLIRDVCMCVLLFTTFGMQQWDRMESNTSIEQKWYIMKKKLETIILV